MLAALAAAVLLVGGAVAASADSLPDSALYPIKGVVEQVRGALAFSPSDQLTYHLELAQTRLTEAEAMIARHRLDLASQALSAMDDQLGDAAALVKAEKGTDPAIAADLENRLLQAIATHDGQLARLQGQGKSAGVDGHRAVGIGERPVHQRPKCLVGPGPVGRTAGVELVRRSA